jgi:hypothetical protein
VAAAEDQPQHPGHRADTPERTLAAWLDAARLIPDRPWAASGPAGAERVARAAEPADVTVWISGDDVPEWEHLLVPRRVAPGKGLLLVAVAPDPWTLSLSSTGADGARIADPVQLHLDCASEGERAAEADPRCARTDGLVKVAEPTALRREAVAVVEPVLDDIVVIGAVAVMVALSPDRGSRE